MRLKRRLDVNPIIVKELRSRMRGARAFVILTGVLLLLGGVSYALYRIVLATSRYSASPLSPQIGQALFSGLVFLELMMVCFITPAVTAGSISGEQEKLTYEMLLATPLRPISILWGKLFSSLSYVFLLIFAAVPMASLVFIFGGVTPRDMIKSLIVLVTIAVTLGVIGVFMSAWLRRTARATVLTYLVVLALLVGPLFIFFLVGVLRQQVPPRWILVPNPASALFSALTSSSVPSGGTSAGLFLNLGMILGGDLRMIAGSGSVSGIPRPLYHYTLPLYGVGTLVLYLLTTRLIQPTRRWRIGWKEVAVTVALLLIFGGVVALAFFSTTDRYEKVSILAAPTPVPVPVPVIVEKEVAVPVVVAPPVPTPATLPPITLADQSAIYVAVVQQLYTVDHTFDEPPNFLAVYLVRATDDGVGDPDAPRTGSQVLPETVQTAVAEALADLPADFLWVDDANEVPREEKNGTVKDGGAIFTLGNIHLQTDGSALVSAELYFSALGAGGKTFVLQQVDGIWQVMGDTGVQWIS